MIIDTKVVKFFFIANIHKTRHTLFRDFKCKKQEYVKMCRQQKPLKLHKISPHIKPGIANPQVSYAWLHVITVSQIFNYTGNELRIPLFLVTSCFVDKIIELFHDDFLSVDNV